MSVRQTQCSELGDLEGICPRAATTLRFATFSFQQKEDFPVIPLKDDIHLKNCLFTLILVKFTKNGLDHTGLAAPGEALMREKPKV